MEKDFKVCPKCKVKKSSSEFYKQLDGLSSYCKTCNSIVNKERRQRIGKDEVNSKLKVWRDNNRQKVRGYSYKSSTKSVYGITREEYNACMATSSCCQICGKKTTLCYDHDHETMKFRGVLCRKCNSAVGKLGDNIEGLEKALSYLKEHYGKTE